MRVLPLGDILNPQTTISEHGDEIRVGIVVEPTIAHSFEAREPSWVLGRDVGYNDEVAEPADMPQDARNVVQVLDDSAENCYIGWE
jgi:hypothetical protein